MKDKHSIGFSNIQKKETLLYPTVCMVKRCIEAVCKEEGLDARFFVDVTFVCDRQIRRMNREHRNIDSATDVLSFPNLECDKQHRPLAEEWDADPETGRISLGDIVISLEHCRAQAEEFGHSQRREVAYLTVHSMYHLLGYDHMEEAEKREMREKEETVLKKMGITRESEQR